MRIRPVFAPSKPVSARPQHGAVILLILGSALLGACGGKPPARQQRQSVAVTVVPVRRMSVPYDVSATGVVTPLQTATVVPQVDGLLKDVAFSEGQDVTQGQVLFRIDPRPYQAAHDQAVAALARDRATAAYSKEEAARYDTLLMSRSVTQEQAEQARATAKSAQASADADAALLDAAQFNLDNTTIRAPISGRTGSLLVHVGNVVHAAGGTPLVVINQVRPTMVRFAVPANILPVILRYNAQGKLPVTVVPTGAPPNITRDSSATTDARAGRGLAAPRLRPADSAALNPDSHGTLSFIDNAVDTTTEMLQLKATFPNRMGTLWAGQFTQTSLRLFVEDSAIVVPTAAVVIGQSGTYVWVVDSSNTAEERPVVVERAAGDMSVISSGVGAGERVVTSGQSRLTTGASVTFGTGDSTAAGGGRRGGRGGGRGKGGGGRSASTAGDGGKPTS